jgi:cobalt-zinc-cadmium efflux system membrane fusion protein
MSRWFSLSGYVLALTLCAVLFGCGTNDQPAADTPAGDAHARHDHAGHEHGAWWCAEHGIPEEECAQCNAALAADFQKKGDWCEMHNRPDSQCFICHPELEAKFAAKYEAKYGKQPPKPESATP